MKPKILIVDDDTSNLTTYQKIFERQGFDTVTAEHPQKAFEAYREQNFDVVLCDIQMPAMTGDKLMENCLKINSRTPFVFVTAYGTIQLAVNLLRNGAFHFLTKPVVKAQLIKSVEDAMASSRVPQQEVSTDHACLGEDPQFKDVVARAIQAASSSSSILIQGENGTGKEMLANLIHQHSPRKDERFVAVNCSAIPEALIEAELFGVTKGAFTGATSNKAGRIEMAHKGTLFLDEIGELSPSVQVKLLRVLQEGSFERLGSSQTQKSDFRLISATHTDLEQAVRQGTFREDLYYRIHVVNFEIPPLRQRPSDIALLAQHFCTTLSEKMERNSPQFSREALEKLAQYDWPGNIRQLQNTIEQALVFCGHTLNAQDLRLRTRDSWQDRTVSIPIGTPLREIEKKVILDTLEATNYDKELTASLLGTTKRTLYRRFDEWREDTDEVTS